MIFSSFQILTLGLFIFVVLVLEIEPKAMLARHHSSSSPFVVFFFKQDPSM
jgi:hypothetical protein